MRNRLRNIVGYIKKGRWRWYTIAGCFALAVTIFTSYALIRPAITMEQKSTADEAAMLTQTSFTDPDLPEVTVSGMLPKGGGVSVTEVKGNQLTELEAKLREKIRAERPGVLFVADSAYDIEIHDDQGKVFEPDEYDGSVTVSVKKDGAKDGSEILVAREAKKGGFEEPVRVEVGDGKIEYEADHFSKMINGVEYYEFSSLTARPRVNQTYVGQNFEFSADFQFEDLHHANFYGEIPYDSVLVDYAATHGDVTLDGRKAGTYQVVVDGGKAYLCISLLPAYAQGSAGRGTIVAEAKAIKSGELHFDDEVLVISDPKDEKYDKLSITKDYTDRGPVTSGEHRGDFYITYEIRLKNNGEETVSGLTVYDIPQYLDTKTRESQYGFYDEGQLKIFSLLYPDNISGGGYTMTIGSGSQFSSEAEKQGYFSVPNVSVAPGQEIVWQYTVYLSKEDAQRLDAYERWANWKNYAGFKPNDNKGKEVSKDVNYSPDTTPLKKVGVIPSEDGNHMEWTISLETKGYYDASGSYISDRLNRYVTSDDLQYIIDNSGNERPYVYVFKNGQKQEPRVYLTWQRVIDATARTTGNPTVIYYDDNGNFRWFSEQKNDANYGYELHYWTTFNRDWLSADAINQAASNFSDQTMPGIDGEYETNVSLVKRLEEYDNANHTANWTIEMPVMLTGDTQMWIADQLPNTFLNPAYDYLRDTMDFMNSIVKGQSPDGNLLLTDDSLTGRNSAGVSITACQRYYEFDSVADFEAFTGIQVEVTGNKTAKEVFCGTGKLGFYADAVVGPDGKPMGGGWMIYPNAVSGPSTRIDAAGEQMSGIEYFFPRGEYTVRFNYTTNTPLSTDKEETNINRTLIWGVSPAGNEFYLTARDAYYMAPADLTTRVDKRIAKVETREDGKVLITYMALVDNRSVKYTLNNIVYRESYEDFLSGLPEGSARMVTGDPTTKDGVTIYKVPVTYDPNDPTGWSMTKASSLEDLTDSSKGFIEVKDPLDSGAYWGGITRERLDENGFMFRVYNQPILLNAIYQYARTGRDDGTGWFQVLHNTFDFAPGASINWSDATHTQFDKMTKSSYYFVYTVEVDEEDLSNADVLRNTIVTYGGPNDSPTGRAYQDYAVKINDLRKTITEKPSAANDYTVSFQLDVRMTEALRRLQNFTITDKLSDNLEFDVQSLKIYRINSDGTETLIPSGDNNGGEHYTSMYTDHNLVIAMDKGNDDWSHQYAVRYDAFITDYDGRVHYENEARIPEGSNVPHITEGDVYVKRAEVEVTNLRVNIYKYDGNNTAQALGNAKFKLLQLKTEYRNQLKELANQPGTTQADIDNYLNSLQDNCWTQFDDEKTTAADGTATFGTYRDNHGESHSILFNEVYKLQETTPPPGYSATQIKNRYFMFYTTTYPSYQNVEGVEDYIRSFVPETAMLLIPNYKTSFRVYKTSSTDTTKRLTDVRFELFSNAACTEHISGYDYPHGQQTAAGYIYFPDIPVPAQGTVQYYLKEIQAPKNYLLNAKRVFVVNVSAEGQLTFEEKVNENGTLRGLREGETPSVIDSTGIGITIANEPNITEFEFNKQWLFAGAEQEWPDDVEKITVTLQRTCKTGDGQDVIETVTFDVTPKMTGSIDLSTISGSQISGTLVQLESQPNIYTYQIKELDEYYTSGDEPIKWTYSISEATVDGYLPPKYIKKGESQPTGGATSVGDCGTIQNNAVTAILPNAGGHEAIVTTIGVVLLILAAVCMIFIRLRRSRERGTK